MKNVVIGFQNEIHAKKMGYGDNSIICEEKKANNLEKIPPKPSEKTRDIERKIVSMGRKAFRDGLPHAPITDLDFTERLSKVSDIKGRERASELWCKGWTIENLSIYNEWK